MYDVEKLVSIVCDYLDAEADYMKYSLDARKELGLAPDSTLWIPSLNGSKAYRLGELFEKSGATGSILADICAMLDINQELLVPLSNPCNARNAITDAGTIRIIPAG